MFSVHLLPESTLILVRGRQAKDFSQLCEPCQLIIEYLVTAATI